MFSALSRGKRRVFPDERTILKKEIMPLTKKGCAEGMADEFIPEFASSPTQADTLQKRQAFSDSAFDHSSST